MDVDKTWVLVRKRSRIQYCPPLGSRKRPLTHKHLPHLDDERAVSIERKFFNTNTVVPSISTCCSGVRTHLYNVTRQRQQFRISRTLRCLHHSALVGKKTRVLILSSKAAVATWRRGFALQCDCSPALTMSFCYLLSSGNKEKGCESFGGLRLYSSWYSRVRR